VTKGRIALISIAGILAVGAGVLFQQIPSIAACGLLYPSRHRSSVTAPANCAECEFAGEGVKLRGWSCTATTVRRGTIVYLHGVADNHGSSVGAIQRFSPRGFDVVAYDSRRHGASDGSFCTYGYFEKVDLRRVIDTVPPGPVFLLGTSLGAAVALPEAADDRRITGVVAAEVFSDLRTVATERAPFFLSQSMIENAIAVAEEQAQFRIDDVSPVDAAASIRVPVLLIHGAGDLDTVPDHSERVLEALAGPKRLILVEGVGHNHSLSDAKVWTEVEGWVDAVLRSAR
jgi:pimeloyl-ACP methyl ester carboxylesterase